MDNVLKRFFLIFLFFSFTSFSQSQGQNNRYFFTISSNYQNEDIFTNVGAGCRIKNYLNFEFMFGVGVRRTFFQGALFSKEEFRIYYDFLKSEKSLFGPLLQLAVMQISPQIFTPLQKYNEQKIGYVFAYGSRLKFFQSSSYGRSSMRFSSSLKRYNYWSYSFHLGLRYEI